MIFLENRLEISKRFFSIFQKIKGVNSDENVKNKRPIIGYCDITRWL